MGTSGAHLRDLCVVRRLPLMTSRELDGGSKRGGMRGEEDKEVMFEVKRFRVGDMCCVVLCA